MGKQVSSLNQAFSLGSAEWIRGPKHSKRILTHFLNSVNKKVQKVFSNFAKKIIGQGQTMYICVDNRELDALLLNFLLKNRASVLS